MANNKDQENPLANIMINVLLPVVALGAMSKEGDKLWHLGPVKGMILALALPLGYGIWNYIKTKKINTFSLIGLLSVVLTGGLTIYLWNKDGTIKPNAALLFGIKEAAIPLVLGICVIASHRSANPLLRTFLYSDAAFNIPVIEKTVAEKNVQPGYAKLLWQCTLLFSSSFLMSAALNLYLAHYFLNGLVHTDPDAREKYNILVGKITGWGFLVIGVPLLIFLALTLWKLVSGLKKITGLSNDEILLPR